ITVDPDGSFAQFSEIRDGAQAAADESLKLVGPATDFAARRLAANPRLRRTGKHAVFRRDPTFAAVAQKLRHSLFEFGRADDLRISDFNQHRAVRRLEIARRNPQRPQLFGFAPVCSHLRSKMVQGSMFNVQGARCSLTLNLER